MCALKAVSSQPDSLEDKNIEAIDKLLRSVDLHHGVRSEPGWVRARSPRGGGDQAPRNHAEGRPPAPARPGEMGVVRVPGWSNLKWLRHGFSTRTGGSTTAYLSPDPGQRDSADAHPASASLQPGELNLGFTASDHKQTVLRNRAEFLAALLAPATTERPSAAGEATPAPATHPPAAPPALVTLRQIHSSLIRRVGASDAGPVAKWKGDGLMTNEPGVILAIQTADCIPVLIADRRRKAVAAFHAGWRGTLRRIVENGVGRMRLEFGSEPEDLIAAIGPGIGQCCYSVGEEVRTEFESQFSYAAELFCEIYDSDPVRERYPLLFLTARAPGHSDIGPAMHLDLMEANRQQLLAAGLPPGNIYLVGECTSCRKDRYFSHRAEHGVTGRMLSAIGIL
ncbi:MAG TPA: peptidoglycan editing factor PgeF [Acidisarcina sp.]